MTVADFIPWVVGPISGAAVAWLLSARTAHATKLETRVSALEIAHATLRAGYDATVPTILAKLESIEQKIDQLKN